MKISYLFPYTPDVSASLVNSVLDLLFTPDMGSRVAVGIWSNIFGEWSQQALIDGSEHLRLRSQ